MTKKGKYLFEIVKITGLVLWFLYASLEWIYSGKGDVDIGEVLLTRLSQAVAGYIVISLVYLVFLLLVKRKVAISKILLFSFTPLLILATILWDLACSLSYWLFFETGSAQISFYFNIVSFLYHFLPTLVFLTLFFVVLYWRQYTIQKEKAMIASNLANEAQLKMLRYQINPHFLFNALNTIRNMINEDKDTARRLVTEFSNYFRYSLQKNNYSDSLENELKAVRNYLEIQKIRFEEKLNIQFDIKCDSEKIYLPFFLILPLVENAIKYGLQTSKMPLEIIISVTCKEQLIINVRNTGCLVKSPANEESTATGIENIKQRLALCFSDNFSFSIDENKGWVNTTIKISDNSVFQNKVS